MTWKHCPVGYNTPRATQFCHCLYQPHTRHLHASLISVAVSNVTPQRLLLWSRYIFRKRGQDIFHARLYSKYLPQYTDGSGHAVAQLVEALSYKPDGRWFDSRWYEYGPGIGSRITGTLRKCICTFIIISGWNLLRMRNVSGKSCR